MIIDEKRLHWLAGLLEGEASFMLTRSDKNLLPRPTIKLIMRDLDIVQRVADLFAVKVQEVPPRQENWNTTYLALLRGIRAYDFMQVLQPLMGNRRQQQIDKVFAGYVPVHNRLGSNSNGSRLNEAQVRQIKQRIMQGETAKEIAPDYGVTHYTIWAIRSGKTWSHVSIHDENTEPPAEDHITVVPCDSQAEKTLYWLAGLLEGEGSFVPPPPSAPNQPAIQVAMTDEDVIARVAELFDVQYYRWQRKNTTYKASYQTQLRGSRAVTYMRQLYPLMGERRQEQIDRALATYAVHDQRGEKNPLAKLSAEQVMVIKERLRDGDKPRSIAEDMGVSYHAIIDIKLGRTWQHV